MHLKRHILFAGLLFQVIPCDAQTDSLPVRVLMDKTGDSLWFTVTINKYTGPASLMFTASQENSLLKDTFFFPVIDRVSQCCFIYPSFFQNNLLLEAYFYPGIFRVSGLVNNLKRSSTVKALVITGNNKIYNKEIVFTGNNSFTLPALVFEKQATLAFSYSNDKKWKNHPDVSIKVSPGTTDFIQQVFRSVVIRQSADPGKQGNGILRRSARDSSDKKYRTLTRVEVTGVKKSNIQKFNEEYSTGFFNDNSEKIFDCLDNNDISAYPDCISYLQGRVAGLSTGSNGLGEMLINWRGHSMKAFYIDEMPVELDQLLGVNSNEIAMIKVYPPPFFGSSRGDGGAIALYTRRGAYARPGSNGINWLFTLKGYSPPVNVLFENKK